METYSASEITDNIHKFSHEYLLRQMWFLMYLSTKNGGGG